MKIPAFTLPAPIALIGARLPQLPPTLALVAGLNLALDRILPRDTLEPLTGKRLLLKLTDAGFALRFTFTPRGFRPLLDTRQPDLTISATTRFWSAMTSLAPAQARRSGFKVAGKKPSSSPRSASICARSQGSTSICTG